MIDNLISDDFQINTPIGSERHRAWLKYSEYCQHCNQVKAAHGGPDFTKCLFDTTEFKGAEE